MHYILYIKYDFYYNRIEKNLIYEIRAAFIVTSVSS